MAENEQVQYEIDGAPKDFDWDEVKSDLLEKASPRFTLKLNRDRQDGLTFSPEAVETLARGLLVFVMARLDSYWKQEHEPPTKLEVTFDLSLDHERR